MSETKESEQVTVKGLVPIIDDECPTGVFIHCRCGECGQLMQYLSRSGQWRNTCGDNGFFESRAEAEAFIAQHRDQPAGETPKEREVSRDDILDLLRRSFMEHGDCNSGERYGGLPKACTACMATLKLREIVGNWKGRKVRLA